MHTRHCWSFDNVAGSKIHVGITDQVRIQFKVIVNIFEHVHSIVVNDKDFVNIAQDKYFISYRRQCPFLD